MNGNPVAWLLKGTIIISIFSNNPYPTVGAIPVPAGYHRVTRSADLFGAWLRKVPLKKDLTVRLFDGRPKASQDVQFAVLDISVGHKDLQQCADAVMRLRAEFLYSRRDYRDIDFRTQGGVRLQYQDWAEGVRYRLAGQTLQRYTGAGEPPGSRSCFDEYLETVFSYCGTLSLERQLRPVDSLSLMRPGDVFIRGGAPGHAMIVMDMAEDDHGHRVYLLAQGYMPAQDIHIVRNPADPAMSPWYPIDPAGKVILTPEWTFYPRQLRTWPKIAGGF